MVVERRVTEAFEIGAKSRERFRIPRQRLRDFHGLQEIERLKCLLRIGAGILFAKRRDDAAQIGAQLRERNVIACARRCWRDVPPMLAG